MYIYTYIYMYIYQTPETVEGSSLLSCEAVSTA